MAIRFDITGDNSNLLNALDGVRSGVKRTAQEVEESGLNIESMFKRMAATAGIAFSVVEAKNFVSEIARVRGDFQQLEIAFTTMLGSGDKANVLLQQLTRTAAITPFDLQGVANGAKQLLAYGTSADEVNDVLVHLGDIAAGLSIPLNDLVYLYGTTMTQGRMFTEDFRQFQGRGVPIADELAKQFGVTKDKVGDLVTAGKVGAEEFNKAIMSMSSGGGKFAGLMEAQSKSITGQISNIEDAVDVMFNDIGKQQEGVINLALDGTSYMVEHWQAVGAAVLAAAETIGIYKATMVAMSAYKANATNIGYDAEIAALQQLIPVQESSANADVEAAMASGQLSEAKAQLIASLREQAVAQTELLAQEATQKAADNTVAFQQLESAKEMLSIKEKAYDVASNELVEAQSALSVAERRKQEADEMLVSAQAFYDLQKDGGSGIEIDTAAQDLAAAASEQLAASKELETAAEAENTAQQVLNTAETEMNTAATAVSTAETKAKAASTAAETAATEANTAQQALNTSATVADTTAKGLWAQIVTFATKAQAAWNASMFASPLFWIAAAIAGATYAVYQFATAEEEADDATKNLSASTDELNKSYAEEKFKIDELFDALRNSKEGTDEYKEAKDAILNQYGSYLAKLGDEKHALDDVTLAYKTVTEEAWNAAKARMKANLWEKENSSRMDRESDDRTQLLESVKKFYKNKSGGYAEKEYMRIIKRIETGRDMSGGQWTMELSALNNDIATNVNNLLKSKEKYNENIDLYNTMYGDVQDEHEDVVITGHKRNKKYYEERKKEAQEELDALSEIEAKGKKGADLRKKIAEYNSKIKPYSSSASGGKSTSKSDDSDKRIEAARKANDDLLNLQRENQEKELSLDEDTTEKKIKQINLSYDKQIDTITKKQRELAEQNKKAGTAGLNANGLTDAQQKEIDKATELAGKERVKLTMETYKEETAAMNDYLKEYGSMEQRRLAITEEYEEKIRKARTEGERLRLKKEQKKSLANVELENIIGNIDWKVLFSGVSNLADGMANTMQDQLKAFTKTDEYKNADADTKQRVSEFIAELRKYVGTDKNATWQKLSTDIGAFTKSVETYNKVVEAEEKAVAERNVGKQKLANKEITEDDFKTLDENAKKAGEATAKAKESMQNFATTLNDTSDEVANFTSGLTVALNKAKGWSGVSGFSELKGSVEGVDALKGTLDSILPSMGDGMAKTIGSSMSNVLGSGLSAIGGYVSSVLSSGLGQMVGIVAQIPSLILNLASGVKNMVTGVLNSFSELFSLRWIDDLVVSILDAVGNLIDTILDLPENLYHVVEAIIVDGVGGLLDGVIGRVGNILTLGALDSSVSSWFTNSNAKEVAETTEKLTKENERLRDSVDSLKDEMTNQGGKNAITTYDEAVRNQQRINENQMDILKAQMRYHGSHHSNAAYWGLGSKEYSQLNALLAQYADKNPNDKNVKRSNVSSLSDIYELTPEQMAYIRTYNVDLWNTMLDQGKYDKSEYWDEYADLAGALDDLKKSFNESITQISFDSLRGNFFSSLMDMDKKASDFADDFSEMMAQAMLNAALGNLFDDELEKFYNDWAKRMQDREEAGQEMTDADVEEYRNRWNQLVEEGMKKRDEIFAITGYDESSTYSQQASSKGFAAMSQDTAEELNGRFTALQISNENISQQVTSIFIQMQAMAQVQVNSNVYLSEIRNLMISSNSFLEDIAKYSKKGYNDFYTILEDMNNNIKKI